MTHGNGELGDATNRPGHDLAEFEEALSALVRRSPDLAPVIHAACRLLIRTVERAGRVAVGDTAESEEHVGDRDLVPPVVTDAPTTPGPAPELVSGPTEQASAADAFAAEEWQGVFDKFSGPSVAPRTDPPRAPTGVKAKPADPDADLVSLRRHVALQQAAIEYWKAKADRGFESTRDTFQRLRDRGEEEQCFMWALDQRTDSLPKARVEEIGEWYAALSDAVDHYLDEDGPGRRSARAFEHLAMVLQSTRESIGVLAQFHLRDDGLTALRHWVGRNRHRFDGGSEKGRDLLSAAYDDVEAARASLERLESDSKAGAERDRDQSAARNKFVYELKRHLASASDEDRHVQGMRIALENLKASEGSATQGEFVERVGDVLGSSLLPESLMDSPDAQALAEALARKHDELTDDAADAESVSSLLVERVREALRGKVVVMVGGDERPQHRAAIEKAFELKELRWLATRPHESHSKLVPNVVRSDVDVVMLLIRWASHSFGDLRDTCENHDKAFIRLPRGYNPSSIAHEFMQQVGRRFGVAPGS